jgi:hypothetical protein
MKQETRVALEKFFSMSNWPSEHPNDMDRFFDFIVTAFKNGDQVISQADMEEIAGKQLMEYQLEALGVYESRFKDGISILNKYVAE